MIAVLAFCTPLAADATGGRTGSTLNILLMLIFSNSLRMKVAPVRAALAAYADDSGRTERRSLSRAVRLLV